MTVVMALCLFERGFASSSLKQVRNSNPGERRSCRGPAALRGKMRKNSIKNVRINAEVQKELSRIIQQEIKDPRIHPMTSVVSAEVTPDLKYCKVYISVLGDADAQKSTIEGLKSAKAYIRRQLAATVNLRNTPELIFVADQSIEYGVHMTGLIDEVARELASKPPAESSEGVDADAPREAEDEEEEGQDDGEE